MSLLDCICCGRHGHRTAVVWDDLLAPSCLSYSVLVEKGCKVACYLRHTAWVSRGGMVGLYGSNCPDILCALLGILAVPAAYVPVDLAQPAAVKERTLRKLRIKCILIHYTFLEDFLAQGWSSFTVQLDTQVLLELGLVNAVLCWPGSSSAVQEMSCGGFDQSNCCGGVVMCDSCKEMNVASERQSEMLDTYATEVDVSCVLCEQVAAWAFPAVPPSLPAYTLHTSGTTGDPKTIRVPHCCIVPNIVDLRKRFGLCHGDTVFNAAPLTFDPSVVEIFLAFSSGSTLLVVPEEVKRSPFKLATVLFHRQYVTVLQTTPSLVKRFKEEDIRHGLLGPASHLRVLAFGGESCPNFQLLSSWRHHQNNTTLFNIYGATEVSSWQTCYQITSEDLLSAKQCPDVPIGEPLLGTMVDLRDCGGTAMDVSDYQGSTVDQQDIRGSTSSQGSGEIWIGGRYRVCWLEGETELVSGCMRPSGDIGYIDGSGRLYCVGRTDRQIKRAGHRVNLDSIQQGISSLREVSACVVTTLLPSELQNSPLKNQLSISTHPPHGTDVHLVVFIVPPNETDVSLTRALMAHIGRVLPSYCVPDDIVLVRELPTTEHGKTDLKSLVQCVYPNIFLPRLTTTTTGASQHLTAHDITDTLLSVASELLGLHTWPDKSCVLELGVDSFEVVRLSNQFETELRRRTGDGLQLTHLVEQLLTRNLLDVVLYISNQISPSSENKRETRGGQTSNEASPATLGQKRQRRSEQEGQEAVTSAKMSAVCFPPATDKMHRWSAWRRGQYLQDGHLHLPSEAKGTLHSDLKCSLKLKWSVDTHKCVDASPLVVKRRAGPWVVYVGSHSGLFLAVEVGSGAVLWRTRLSDRVESSACVSACSQHIVVGCYDGCVYALCADSGEVHFCYHISQDPIKSSPCVDPTTGLVWVGSHDHHLYAISLQDKAVVHRLFPGGGACFSSPCINSDTKTLHCATLEGNITAVDLKTSMVRWVYRCPKPVFSSPALLPNGSVVVGCVDGKVYLIRRDGEMVGVAATGHSIFSSCCVVQVTGQRVRVMSGSHDGCVYCWNEQLGLEWKTELDSEIYSTPCHCTIQTLTLSSTYHISCVCVCSTAGSVYMLDAVCGHILGSFELPGNIFSSPVVVDSCIIVGCRDDHVYCIEIEISKT